MTYNVIASSSRGNAVLVDRVLIDVGVPFNKIKPHIDEFDIVLITHIHSDHLNKSTLLEICRLRPNISIVTHSEVAGMIPELAHRVRLIDLGQVYTNLLKNGFKYEISPLQLYHDVKTFGFRIKIYDTFMDEMYSKVFYATDTGTLEGIVAKDYDFYFIETNYCEEKIDRISEYKKETNQFDDTVRVKMQHLSRQEAENFFVNNKKEDSVIVTLHHSSRNY